MFLLSYRVAYCPIHCPVKYLWDSGNQLLNEAFYALAVLLSHKMALTLSIYYIHAIYLKILTNNVINNRTVNLFFCTFLLIYEGFSTVLSTVLLPFYRTATTPDRTVGQPSSPLYSLCRHLYMAAFELQTAQQRFLCMHRIIRLFHILLPMENQPAGYASLPVFDFPEEKTVRHKVIVNLNFFRVSPSELVTQEPDKFTPDGAVSQSCM